jgi:hypothetical protein
MAKDKLSRDQKRKAKLAERKKHQLVSVTPYEGTKYQQPKWEPVVWQTEKTV